MKLRNKKTGEIFNWREDLMPFGLGYPHPKSLSELCNDWEDVKEPLIKDPKIRKILKAWSEVSGIDTSEIKVSKGRKYISFVGWIEGEYEGVSIDFETCNLDEFQNDKVYTIEELCGEEL